MIITYLRLPLNFNHPRSAIVSKTHTHGSLPVKKKIVIHKQVVLSTCAWSWQGSPSQLPPAVGQEQKTALFLQHCQLKDTPQGHLQTHHLEYLLPRCSQAELGDGKWLLKKKKKPLCGRKLQNTEHQCRTDGTKKAESRATRRESHRSSVITVSSLSEIVLRSSPQLPCPLIFTGAVVGAGCVCWVWN